MLATIPWFPGAGLSSRWSARGAAGERARAARPSTGWRWPIRASPYLPRFGHALSAGLYAAAMLRRCAGARKQFDVLLGTWAYPDGVAAVALGRALGLPTVVKLHGSDMDVLAKRPALRRQLAWALPAGGARGRGQPRPRPVTARGAGRPARTASTWSRTASTATLFKPRDRGGRARRARSRRRRAALDRLRGARRGRQRGCGACGRLRASSRPRAPTPALVFVGDGEARAADGGALRPLGDRVAVHGRAPVRRGAGLDGGLRPRDAAEPPRGDAQRAARGARLGPPGGGDTRWAASRTSCHRPELGELVPVGRRRRAGGGARRACWHAPTTARRWRRSARAAAGTRARPGCTTSLAQGDRSGPTSSRRPRCVGQRG